MGVLNSIIQMGSDPQVTFEQIDALVDRYLAFLQLEQINSPEVNLINDIFDLEAARQQAFLMKFRNG